MTAGKHLGCQPIIVGEGDAVSGGCAEPPLEWGECPALGQHYRKYINAVRLTWCAWVDGQARKWRRAHPDHAASLVGPAPWKEPLADGYLESLVVGLSGAARG